MYILIWVPLFLTLFCSVVQSRGTFRVAGGSAVKDEEFKSIVLLRRLEDEKFSCSGTLVHASVVLTAAHCVVDFVDKSPEELAQLQLEVVAGQLDRKISSKTSQIRMITKIQLHEDYQNGFFQAGNDIALLKMNEPIELDGPSVGLVNLDINSESETKTVDKSEDCFVVGWGMWKLEVSLSGDFSDILRKGKQKLVSNDDCSQTFEEVKDNSGQICAIGEENKVTQCSGDSGGPLYCGSSTNQIQVGIVSYGMLPCGARPLPSVYTSVKFYRQWIDTNVEKILL